MTKLLLGTANFGLSYGFRNNHKRLGLDEIQNILETAADARIDGFDTARAYGDSELIIGDYAPWRTRRFISSKFHETSGLEPNNIVSEILISIGRLRAIPKVFYFHSSQLLFQFSPEKIERVQVLLRENGYQINLGVSVYSIQEVLKIHSIYPNLDCYQMPLNVSMLGTEEENHLIQMQKKGVSFFIRSIFLQGILTMDYNSPSISALNEAEKKLLKAIKDFVSDNNTSVVELSLRYIKQKLSCEGVVVGVDNTEDLGDVVRAFNNKTEIEFPDSFGYVPGIFDLREPRFKSNLGV